MPEEFNFIHRTDVTCGRACATTAAAKLEALGASQPLLVTDPGVSDAGILDPIVDSLEAASFEYAVFDGVEANPTTETVANAAEQGELAGVDSVVGVGGGSSIDTAKAVATVLANGDDVEAYEGVDAFDDPPLPHVAVPTTVGTGSEVSRGFVVSNEDKNRKMVAVSKALFPDVAILDPTLLESLPPNVTASTGMDALTQAIEAYISTGANPFSDPLCRRSVELIATNLRPAVAGNDLDALEGMQVATTLQGIGFHNAGLGLVHAMANTAGAYFDTPHGVTNAVLLPHVLRFNLIARPEKYAKLSETMGVTTDGLSTREAAERFVEAVEQLARDVDIPARLKDIGVDEAAIPEMAAEAVDAIDNETNPRSTTVEQVERLYREAY